jgi:hypothetical protein
MAAPHRLSRTEARRIAIRAQLLEVDRALFEHNATIRPMADLGLFFAGGLDGWTTYDRPRDWVRENDSFRRDILERLRESGPLTSRDIPDTCTVPWASTGWTHKIRNERRLRALGIARAKTPAMPVDDRRRGRRRARGRRGNGRGVASRPGRARRRLRRPEGAALALRPPDPRPRPARRASSTSSTSSRCTSRRRSAALAGWLGLAPVATPAGVRSERLG